MKNLFLLIFIGVLGASCASRVKVMDVSIVSMTQSFLPTSAKLQEKGPVTGTFCSDSGKDRGSIGLFDEAIKSAQTQNSVDFITNVSFWRDEKGCIILEGTGQKILTASAASTEVKGEATGGAASKSTAAKKKSVQK